MKSLKIFLCLLVGLLSFGHSQTIEVLRKNELYKPPVDEMVVMDKYTFGKYHYTAEKYDTLKQEIKELDRELIVKDSLQAELIVHYKKEVESKEKEVSAYKVGYEDTADQLNSSLNKNQQLIIQYKNLEEKRQRTKRWRNLFFTSSLISTGILILLIAI